MGPLQHCSGILFLWTTAPLVLRILDLGPAVTLILVTPPPPAPPPRAAFYFIAGAQGYLPLPLIYIYFPWQHLFIGALHIWHTSLREP